MSGVLEAAFPASVKEAVAGVALLIPAAAHEPAGRFAVRVEGEDLEIPQRIYNPEPPSDLAGGLIGPRREVLACLYTRHHDGRVRQRYLREIIGVTPASRSVQLPTCTGRTQAGP
jgi:hypothetical protein